MNPLSNPSLNGISIPLRPALAGLLLAVCTLLLGYGLGIAFGLNEEAVKARLKTSALEVRETVYHGDDAAIKTVLDKSWAYMKRAHLHAGGLGAANVGLILLTVLLGVSPGVVRVISLGLGAGGFGYSVFWLWAGFRAPAMGGTGLAKESLKWLAMPSSGAVVLSTAAVAVLLIVTMIRAGSNRARP